jgi:serine/threonine protein kinase
MSEPHESSEASLEGLPVPSDAERFRARVPLEILVSRFADSVRRGERPSIEDYALRYRDWAEQIRELFPLIESLERWKVDKEVECLRRNVPDEFPVRQLGDYQFVRELGRGGMGIVFEAVHQQSGRHDAVKLLPWRYAADMAQWKERFQREAATIARLRHPNIVRVYSFGTDEGYCYYAMQLIEGISLDRIIRGLRETGELVLFDEIRRSRGESVAASPPANSTGVESASLHLRRDSWKEFAQIAKQVALALGHAHESGVRHNDVKPANLLLESGGRVIVTDFGIGRRREDDLAGNDEHGTGTLRYMAPERLFGSGDARSDVYALGATLYELCTLRPAFDVEDRRKLVELILKSPPPRPRQIIPQFPRALETIILNAMSPEPGDRYPFAEALAADLLRFINGQPISSTRPGLIRRAWRSGRRRLSGDKRPK